ncbi:hypothetical protein G7071_03630 [Nocardioides piscis]|uniref:WD40 repeat domain-containing protein n=1 Tax=Nocardioides piscis TaxID=2714938 RepID=A0A6G7YCM2_9ACTN|nr:hypothetical protein G7071_03630 [Nocardioides piscis]
MSLHDELQRIADDAPRPDIDHSLWDRGRSLRRRDRLMTSAVVLVMVLTIGGLVALVTGPQPSVGPADDTVPGGAIPSRIEDFPARFVSGPEAEHGTVSWSADVVERNLAVGRVAAAFSTGEIGSLPVAITADDGAYHPLSLPGWMGAGTINDSSGPSGLAVSPDGGHLAYAWWDPAAPLDEPMPSGIRVVDLATGAVQTIALTGGNGVRVRTITWSPDSRWLAWSGDQLASWTPHSSGGGITVAGRVEPWGNTQENVPVSSSRRSVGTVAVANDGSLALGLQSGALLLGAETRAPRRLPRADGTPGAFSPTARCSRSRPGSLARSRRRCRSTRSSRCVISSRTTRSGQPPSDPWAGSTTGCSCSSSRSPSTTTQSSSSPRPPRPRPAPGAAASAQWLPAPPSR